MNSPITLLHWENVDNFTMYRINSLGDGHCLIHSVLYGVSVNYRTGMMNGKKIDKTTFAKSVRRVLSQRLNMIDPNDNGIKTYYETIANGEISNIGNIENGDEDENNDLTLSGLTELLLSNHYLGDEIINLLEKCFNVSIYILDNRTKNVVVKQYTTFYDHCIVLLYNNMHYDLIGLGVIVNGITKIRTKISRNNTFISFLESMN